MPMSRIFGILLSGAAVVTVTKARASFPLPFPRTVISMVLYLAGVDTIGVFSVFLASGISLLEMMDSRDLTRVEILNVD